MTATVVKADMVRKQLNHTYGKRKFMCEKCHSSYFSKAFAEQCEEDHATQFKLKVDK